MIAHRVIDALRGTNKKERLMDVPGVTAAQQLIAANRIEASQKFDFGQLMLEQNPDKSYQTPRLTSDEYDFWRDGYIPLPFSPVWYEFQLGAFKSGVLVYEENDFWVCNRIDLVENETMFVGVEETLDRAHGLKDGVIKTGYRGNTRLADGLLRKSIQLEGFLLVGELVLYLTLMLNSKSTETKTVEASTALNKKRVRDGKTPTFEHRVVTIVPNRFRYEHHAASGEQRMSPRLHWRRSHLRNLSDGRKIVIPRMLVGRADLGEISHEYNIHLEAGNGSK